MASSPSVRGKLLLATVLLALLAFTVPAASAEEPVIFPAGLICEGFDVQWETAFDVDFYRESPNPRASVVHGISLQRGDITLTNLTSGKSVTEYLDGAVFHDRYYADGTGYSTLVGEFVVALFPTDTPAGPSTRLYNGRMTYRTDAEGNWTVLSFRGVSTDLCAALAD